MARAKRGECGRQASVGDEHGRLRMARSPSAAHTQRCVRPDAQRRGRRPAARQSRRGLPCTWRGAERPRRRASRRHRRGRLVARAGLAVTVVQHDGERLALVQQGALTPAGEQVQTRALRFSLRLLQHVSDWRVDERGQAARCHPSSGRLRAGRPVVILRRGATGVVGACRTGERGRGGARCGECGRGAQGAPAARRDNLPWPCARRP